MVLMCLTATVLVACGMALLSCVEATASFAHCPPSLFHHQPASSLHTCLFPFNHNTSCIAFILANSPCISIGSDASRTPTAVHSIVLVMKSTRALM